MRLTVEGCRRRRERIWAQLGNECDVLVFGRLESVQWLCGFEMPAFEYRSNEAGVLLYLTHERAILVGDKSLSSAMGQAWVDERIEPAWYDNRHTPPNRGEFLVANSLAALDSLPDGRFGVEFSGVPSGWLAGFQARRPNRQATSIDDTVRQLRRVKEADELELIRQALRASDAAERAARELAAPGISELDVYRAMLDAASVAQGEPVRLYGDVVSNPVGERRGGPPTGRVIEAGELLLLDYSIIVHGYRGDVATAFLVGSDSPSEELKRRFEACVTAHETAAALLRPAIPARVVAAAVRRVFMELGVADGFSSQTGHGIGLGHPEPPYLVEESSDVLQAGEVVTIEPSQFVPGLCGIRLEHNYWIGHEGTERLSNHPFALTTPAGGSDGRT